MYTAVVADTTAGANIEAGKIIESKWKKVFFNGCCARWADGFIDDIAKIDEIKSTIDTAYMIIKFVQSHHQVKKAYARISEEIGAGSTEMVNYEGFSDSDKMLRSILSGEVAGTGDDGDVSVLKQLVNDPGWTDMVKDVDHGLVASFETFIRDDHQEFFLKVKNLLDLTEPLCSFVRHLRDIRCRASWVLPAFEALRKDVSTWCDSTTVDLSFFLETKQAVQEAINANYSGTRSVGIRAPQHVLAMLLDPATTVDMNALPDGWDDDCRAVLSRFYTGTDLIEALAELNDLVSQEGKWGEEVTFIQEAVQVPTEPNKSRTLVVTEQHMKSTSQKPQISWKIKYKNQFPKLEEPAIRVLTMACSLDVERCAKVHAIVNSKRARNHLKNKSVVKLLYCHVNLRLLKNVDEFHHGLDDDKDLEDFLSGAIDMNATLDAANEIKEQETI